MSTQNNQRKQFTIHFTRVQTSSGKFHTTAKIARTTTTSEKQRGLLHNVYHLKSRLTGDVPSVNNALNAIQPHTVKGRVALSAAKGGYKLTRAVGSAVVKTGLAAESTVLFAADRISPNKQLQVHLTRTQTSNGKYKTNVKFVSNATDFTPQRGVLHKVYHLPDRVKGDKFSLTKKIDSFQPKTAKGVTGKTAVKGTYRFVKASGKLSANAALGAENIALLAKDKVVGKYKQKLKAEMSNQDASKALLTVYGAGKGLKGLVSHVKENKMYRFEKKRLELRKRETKLLDVQIRFGGLFRLRPFSFRIKKADSERSRNRAKFKKRKAVFTADKKKFKAQKQAFKASDKSNISKAKLNRQKADFKAKKKDFQEYKATTNKINSSLKKRKNAQMIITKLTKPRSLISKGVGNVSGKYAEKLRNADNNNDFLALAGATSSTAKSISKTTKKAIRMIATFSESHHAKKFGKQQGRLKQQEYKLKQKKSLKRKKRKRKSVQAEIAQYLRGFVRRTVTVVKSAGVDFGSKFLLALLPIVLFVVVGVDVASLLVSSFISESGWILGTYTADDEQLAEAVHAYTLCARNLNKAVVQCGESNNWKSGLRSAADSSYKQTINGYKETPTTFKYGKSTALNYEPGEYDFDPYVLWSFLSAYYYDFDKADECRSKGKTYSPENWEVTGDTEDLLKALFDTEYTFEFKYISNSRWVPLSTCKLKPTPTVESDGSISYSYHSIFSDTVSQHFTGGNYAYTQYEYRNAPSEIRKFADNNKYIHFDENTLEILDAKNNNARTGWYLQEQTTSIWGEFSDGSSGWRSSFYYTDQYGNLCWGNGEPRTLGIFWGEIGQPSFQDILWCVSPADTNSWNGNLNDVCLVSYYQKNEWKKEVALYYNVKRNCSFEEAAAQMLSNSSHSRERLEFFAVLVGNNEHNCKGNHQCLNSPVSDSMSQIIEKGRIYNGYGYDVENWNSTHCKIKYDPHNGIDISCSPSEQIYAMIDGEVTKIDGDSITIVAKDKKMITSKGSFTITVIYRNVSPTVIEGDILKAGEPIGNATESRQCMSVDNSAFSTNYIHIAVRLQPSVTKSYYTDPRLLIY